MKKIIKLMFHTNDFKVGIKDISKEIPVLIQFKSLIGTAKILSQRDKSIDLEVSIKTKGEGNPMEQSLALGLMYIELAPSVIVEKGVIIEIPSLSCTMTTSPIVTNHEIFLL